MSTFSSANQPVNKGRPKGSKNLRSQITGKLHKLALKKLTKAVEDGEQWAVEAVINRTMPKYKPVSASAEKRLIESQIELNVLKVKEIADFEQRLIELEEAANEH